MTTFPPIPVSSTNVEGVGPFDPVTNTLIITFRGGRVYRYSEFPLEEYFNLMKAPSKGQYVNAFIAYNYPYERLS